MIAPAPTPTQLTSDDAILTLIGAEGNLRLAAEQSRLTLPKFISIIASDPASFKTLQIQLRTLTLLKAYEMLSKAHVALEQSLSDLEAMEASRTYTSLLTAITPLSDNKESTQNINITEMLYRSLPPDVRKAVQSVIDIDSTDPTNGSPPSEDDAYFPIPPQPTPVNPHINTHPHSNDLEGASAAALLNAITNGDGDPNE